MIVKLDGVYRFELPWTADSLNGGRETSGGAATPRMVRRMDPNLGGSTTRESVRTAYVQGEFGGPANSLSPGGVELKSGARRERRR